MFALFHFSPVFPYIHPILFPVTESAPGANKVPAAGSGEAEAEVMPPFHPAQGRRLKGLYRRHQRGLREGLTYSGGLRTA